MKLRQPALVIRCPLDGGPLKPFAEVRANLGFTISLVGCSYCEYDHVCAIATDAAGHERYFAQWSFDRTSNEYILVMEVPSIPSDWLDLARAVLPQRNPS